MSPLNDLLAAIEAEATEERSRLDAGSRAEAEAILQGARETARAERDAILRSAEPDIEAEANRRVALANLEASRLVREAREESFGLLLSEARRELAALRQSDRYRDVMRALLGEAREALPGARTVRVDPRDEALANGLVSGLADGLTVQTAPVGLGGLVLESGDGRVLRNTFEERLANAEPELRLWYGRRLDGLAASAKAAGPR